jgi:archaetidylinositol phosphate synthase
MTLDRFRPHVAGILDPMVAPFVRFKISPDVFSVVAFIAAIGAGITFALHNIPAGVVLVGLNALLDALDGALARAMKIESVRGDFLDHSFDRYADIFIIAGIAAGGAATWEIALFALSGVLMSSYMGTQAQAVGVGRYYGGVLGRADRLVLLLIAGVLDIFIAAPYGIAFLAWLLVLFGIFGHATAVQRFLFVLRRLY